MTGTVNSVNASWAHWLRARDVSRRAVLVAWLGTCAAGCDALESVAGFFSEPKPDLEDPKNYDKAGVSFAYPGNWSLEEEKETTDGIETTLVTVESKGAAILSVQIYRPGTEVSAKDYAVEFVDLIEEEMANMAGPLLSTQRGKVTSFDAQFLGQSTQGARAQYTAIAAGERVPMTLDIRVADLDDVGLLVFSQIPDEDAAVADPGFELIRSSLRVVH